MEFGTSNQLLNLVITISVISRRRTKQSEERKSRRSLLRILSSPSHLSHNLSQIDVFLFENLHLDLKRFSVRLLLHISLFEVITLKTRTVEVAFPADAYLYPGSEFFQSTCCFMAG